MEIKLIEVRDSATTVPMMAVLLSSTNEREKWLLSRAGYAREIVAEPRDANQYVLLVNLTGGRVQATYDPYRWDTSARTFPVAHQYLIDNWTSVKNGDVVDVQHIIGETREPKTSDQFYHNGGC